MVALALAAFLKSASGSETLRVSDVLGRVVTDLECHETPGSAQVEYELLLPDKQAGTYRLLKLDKDNYLEEIRLTGRTHLSGRRDGIPWEVPEGQSLALVNYLLNRLLSPPGELQPDSDEPLSGRAVGGGEIIEIAMGKNPREPRQSIYVKAASWQLAAIVSSEQTDEYAGWRELSGYGLLPGRARRRLEGEVALEVVLKSATNKPPSADQIDKPLTAIDLAPCARAEDASVAWKARPNYPEAVRLARGHGVVIVEGVIAPEGGVRDLHVLHVPALKANLPQLLAEATLEAVARWSYVPARCGDLTFPVRLTVSVTYSLH
jgi:TonB family protein